MTTMMLLVLLFTSENHVLTLVVANRAIIGIRPLRWYLLCILVG